MEAGHGGKSGRFQKYHSVAEYDAFMLEQLGVGDVAPAPSTGAAGSERGR